MQMGVCWPQAFLQLPHCGVCVFLLRASLILRFVGFIKLVLDVCCQSDLKGPFQPE